MKVQRMVGRAAGKKRNRILRWAVWCVAACVCLFAIASVALFVLARSASTRWERLASDLRAKGQPLTFAEIEAQRPSAPDDENGAIVVYEAAQILDGITQPDNSGVLFLDDDCAADFFEGVDSDCLAATRAYVESRRPALSKLAELARYPSIRPEVSHGVPIEDVPTREVQIGSRYRSLAKQAHLDTVVKSIDGKKAAAVDAHLLQLRLNQPLFAEPSLFLHLMAVSNDWLAATALEALLHLNELTVDDLKRLQLAWDRHLAARSMETAILGQRASVLQLTGRDRLMRHARAAGAALDADRRKRWQVPNPMDWLPFKDNWLLLENRIRGVSVLTRLLDVSGDYSKLLTLARREQASMSGFNPGGMAIRIMMPSLVHSIELHIRSAARFRCGPAAIAAERFRLAHGRFPDEPEKLLPDYLPAWPRDPFDGRDMRMTRTDAGLVIYSIGENRIDDGGKVVPRPDERLAPDFGLRLVHPDGRGVRVVEQSQSENE